MGAARGGTVDCRTRAALQPILLDGARMLVASGQ